MGDDGGFSMGKVINKTTNSYDGFIGMVQRKVSRTVNIIIIITTFPLWPYHMYSVKFLCKRLMPPIFHAHHVQEKAWFTL